MNDGHSCRHHDANVGSSIVLCRKRRSILDLRSVNDGRMHNGFAGSCFSDDCRYCDSVEGLLILCRERRSMRDLQIVNDVYRHF